MADKTDNSMPEEESASEAKAEAPEGDTAETEAPEAEPEGAEGTEVAGAPQAAADPSADLGAAGPPFDPTAVRIETKALSVDALVQRMAEGGIDLSPAGEGSPIWTAVARSRLVESLLLRMPLPAFYFDASAPDSWSVVDGLHRLAALDAFVNNGAFGLSGLEFFDHLEGKTFKELPRHFQRRILETQVTGHLIQEGTPEPVRAAIMRRIDTGSGRLS